MFAIAFKGYNGRLKIIMKKYSNVKIFTSAQTLMVKIMVNVNAKTECGSILALAMHLT